MREEIEDGEFTERIPVSRVPATLDTFSLTRHELMAGKSNPQIEALAKELEIDKELGLPNQACATADKALKQDIDELTSSNNYFEVSKSLLRRLFKINTIRFNCTIFNIMSPIKGFFKAGTLPLSLHLMMLLLIYPMIKYSCWVWPAHSGSFMVTMAVLNVVTWIGMLLLIIFGFATWEGRTISWASIGVDLENKPLRNVDVKIPYGAKLKVLEAKKTNIFEDFVYICPKFKAERHNREVRFPRFELDPAILGVTKDERMYMIVYWDLDRDVEKVVKEIEHFKKFKLKK